MLLSFILQVWGEWSCLVRPVKMTRLLYVAEHLGGFEILLENHIEEALRTLVSYCSGTNLLWSSWSLLSISITRNYMFSSLSCLNLTLSSMAGNGKAPVGNGGFESLDCEG